MVRCEELLSRMPTPEVFVTVKPRTVTYDLPDSLKPLTPPVTVTVAPGAAVKTMGALAVPERGAVTASRYVPAATCTVWPATALAAPAPIVQNGVADDPGPLFEHAELPLSTKSVVGVAARA